jgi:hypothetical protein
MIRAREKIAIVPEETWSNICLLFWVSEAKPSYTPNPAQREEEC